MKIKIAKKDLLRAATIAANAAAKKSSIATLTQVKLEAGAGLRLSGTDLYTGASVLVACEVSETGIVTVPARQFVDAVRGLPDEDVTIATDDAGRIVMKAKRAVQRLPYGNAADYPELPSAENATPVYVPADVLAAAIAGVAHSVGTDETQAHLNGLMIEIGSGRVRAVATDGKTLSRCDRACNVDGSVSVYVPHRSLAELRRTLDAAETESVGVSVVGASMAFVDTTSTIFSMKLTGDNFIVGWERAVPVNHKHRIVANRSNVLDAIKRVISAAPRPNPSVAMSIADGALTVRMSDAGCEAVDVVECDYSGSGLTIHAAAGYMTAALGACTADEILIGLTDELSPILVQPSDSADHILIVMPMRG